MEDLSAFIASAIEFIIGGIMFGAALGLLLLGTRDPSLSATHIDELGRNSATVGVVLVSLGYAIGVVAESLARGIFEFMLDRTTVRSRDFLPGPAERVPPVRPLTGLRAIRRRVINASLGRDETPDGWDYVFEDRRAARKERERQRTAVMRSDSSTLSSDVQAQLKRLRMERVFTISLAVLIVALAVHGEVVYAILAAAATAWMVWSIHTRFGRFCGAIARSYQEIQLPSGLSGRHTAPDGPAPS